MRSNRKKMNTPARSWFLVISGLFFASVFCYLAYIAALPLAAIPLVLPTSAPQLSTLMYIAGSAASAFGIDLGLGWLFEGIDHLVQHKKKFRSKNNYVNYDIVTKTLFPAIISTVIMGVMTLSMLLIFPTLGISFLPLYLFAFIKFPLAFRAMGNHDKKMDREKQKLEKKIDEHAGKTDELKAESKIIGNDLMHLHTTLPILLASLQEQKESLVQKQTQLLGSSTNQPQQLSELENQRLQELERTILECQLAIRKIEELRNEHDTNTIEIEELIQSNEKVLRLLGKKPSSNSTILTLTAGDEKRLPLPTTADPVPERKLPTSSSAPDLHRLVEGDEKKSAKSNLPRSQSTTVLKQKR